jgi:CDP-glycerol glycerophosphotransferase (TagB/SpsB family)
VSRSRLVRRLAGRALRRVGILPPRICFVVAGGDAPGLDATLHALRALPRADVAILVAATAGSTVATAHAAADWRVRLVDPWWPAAARAATRTRAAHVVALRGGDLPNLAGLMEAVDRPGQDTWSLGVGTDLSVGEPAAAVFGRRTWRATAPAGSAELALVQALARVPAAVRLPGAPGQVPSSTVRGMVDTRADLPDWLRLQESAADLLGPDSPWYSAWATSSLARGAQRHLEDAERYSPRQWADLQRAIGSLAVAAGDDGVGRLPVESRVRVVLAGADRRDDLVRFVADRRFAAGHYATTSANGVVTAILPVPADLPEELCRLSAAETPLRTSVRRLYWTGDHLHIEVFACVGNVDLLEHEPTFAARLVDGARDVRLDLEPGSDREVTRWMGSHHVNHDRGVFSARVPVADLAVPGRLTLEVTVEVAGLVRRGRVSAHDPGGSAALLAPRVHDNLWVRAELTAGFALVTEPERPPVATAEVVLEEVELGSGRLTVQGPGVDQLVLRRPQGPPLEPEVADGSVSWTLGHDPWGFGPQPLPPGRYVLVGRDGRAVGLAEGLASRLTEIVLTDDHRVVVSREARPGGHALVIALGPPLADDETGPYCQHRLQEWYADRDAHPLEPSSVYLQAYTGQSATDSPLAIAEELARTRPDLTLTWAVADRAARVPTRSRTVLWRSRAWYAALARSAHVVTNIELESWFRRRPGQEVLQTFHGYPSKAMGIGLWQQKNFTPTRIEQQLDRTSRNWSLLLTPIPEMDVHYRENYRYDGPILATGYPRDDALVAPTAADTRLETRARLGLDHDTVAVLYAPTWRDDQATDFRAARMVDHLDVTAAARALGPGYVLLLRGHRFMSATDPGDGSRVLDVTAYPEINDLILAADAAVLDYSSMRFDFALTGRPMVFLVPDLEDYATAKRGFLYDFAPTAPGPHARSSAEVVEALRDLDGVRERHREAYERFNATYNRLQDGAAARRVVDRFF